MSVGQALATWRERDHRSSYSRKKALGGGVLLDLVHDINYPAWLLGEAIKPLSGIVRRMSRRTADAEDIAESLWLSRSGVIVSIHQDYLRMPGRRSLEIIGENGSLLWDSETKMIAVQAEDSIRAEGATVENNEMYVREVEFFLQAIRRNKYVSNLTEAIQDVKNIEFLKRYAK